MKESNKLIAEFMGLPLVPCSIGTENGIVYEGYQHTKGDMPFTADGLQYKYSWDWLMPVVQKIKEFKHYQNIDGLDYALLCCLTIENLYIEVVEFIKEYNKLNN